MTTTLRRLTLLALCLLAASAALAKIVPLSQAPVDKRMDIEVNNLLDNPYLKEGASVPPRHWNLTLRDNVPVEQAFQYAPPRDTDARTGGRRSFRLNSISKQAVVLMQNGLYLVPGEPYRVSGYIRGMDFSGSVGIGVIGKTFSKVRGLTCTTQKINSGWHYFEVEFTHDLADICRFVMFLQKGSAGSVLIERPILEPLSQKGLRESRRLLPNDDFDQRYAKARKEGFRSGPPSPDYRLVWQDEFDGTALDTSKWVNYYLDIYRVKRKKIIDTPRCARLNGKGQIELVAEYDAKEDLVYLPFLTTKGKYTPKYGYFECRFRLHQEDMLNAAFWLLSIDRNLEKTIGPVKNGHEIDIMECILPSCEQISQTTHYRRFDGKEYSIPAGGTIARKMPGFSKGWHTVGFEWTPDAYRWFIDGVESYAVTKDVHPIADAPLLILVTFEIHKTLEAQIHQAHKPWRSSLYTVDYVRVYQKP